MLIVELFVMLFNLEKKMEIKKVIELFIAIAEINKSCNYDANFSFEDHLHKNYYAVNLSFKNGNSEYKDCLVMYVNEDFDGKELLNELNSIVHKAENIFNT